LDRSRQAVVERQHPAVVYIRLCGRGNECRKFVPAEARCPEHVRLFGKALADLPQHLVTDRVTVLIVQWLEAIKIYED
jgi:hypothetical protein